MNVQTSTAHKSAALELTPARRSRFKSLLAAVLLIAAGVAAYYYLPRLSGPASPNEIILSGNIEAHQSLVGFKDVSSRIVELPFDEGQWVEKGALLARLDDSNYRQQVMVAEAAVRVQQQQLASARANLVASQGTVANDEADFSEKTADFHRFQELWNDGATSAQSRDQSETAMKQALAALQRDRALESVARQNIATAQANIKDAEENLRLANLMVDYTVLHAPFSGVVVVRQTELGEVMQPGTPVVTLADLDHVWLRAYVSETDLGRIHWGQAASVTTDTYPGKKYPGKISFISSSAEFTPKSVQTHEERVTLVYRIKIDIDNRDHSLKPGMPADAAIEVAARSQSRSFNVESIFRH